MGESWLRKISVGPVDPGCLLAVLPSSSQSNPTPRPRISHQNLLSHRWMSKSCLIFWRLQAVNFYAHKPPVFASWHLSRAPTVRTVTNAAKIMVRNTIVYIWEIRKCFFFSSFIHYKKSCIPPPQHISENLHLILQLDSYSFCEYRLGNVLELKLVANKFIFCTGH